MACWVLRSWWAGAGKHTFFGLFVVATGLLVDWDDVEESFFILCWTLEVLVEVDGVCNKGCSVV